MKEANEQVHNIEVSVEVTHRMAKELTVGHEDYLRILEGDTEPIKALFKEAGKNKDVETDYAVFDIDTEKQVVDWR